MIAAVPFNICDFILGQAHKQNGPKWQKKQLRIQVSDGNIDKKSCWPVVALRMSMLVSMLV